MGLRFRKSINLGGGVKLNVSKKSVGISAGVKGARVSINSKGRKTTSVGIPGTGVSYVSTSNISKGKSNNTTTNNNKSNILVSELELTEENVLKRSNEYKRISKALFIIAILLFIAAFPLGAFVFLLSIVAILFACLTNIMGRFIKWQGLKQLKDKDIKES
ncbi:DUF4236 domain-containing protein [Romboutsia sp. 1001713B170207_170306_H8]|uniref:DUF4236 domain-containing protein n=1 Tax=Romboutsia sp. 1001713B170207_170306_H8 TaxID=2787112 RepID=UPI000822BB77|nr:DUF4236 domain-containing protein [Romboutsia sp. 1001713B170207_170306_H8]SCI09783.1 Uncharacterised protein [uncultured Clostridium sp.]